MTIRDAIAEIEQIALQVEESGSLVVDELVERGVQIARERSSGTASEAQLRREDHPYARRHGAPRRDPSIINRHRGVFYAAWRSVSAFSAGQIINDSDVANFMRDGTTYMFERPVGVAVEEDLAAVAPRIATDVLARLVRQLG